MFVTSDHFIFLFLLAPLVYCLLIIIFGGGGAHLSLNNNNKLPNYYRNDEIFGEVVSKEEETVDQDTR